MTGGTIVTGGAVVVTVGMGVPVFVGAGVAVPAKVGAIVDWLAHTVMPLTVVASGVNVVCELTPAKGAVEAPDTTTVKARGR